MSLPMTSQSAGQSLAKSGRPLSGLRQVAGEGNVVDQGVKPDVGDEFGVERELDSPGKAALGAGNAEVRVKVNGVEHFRLAEGRKDKITALFHELLHPFHMVGQAEIPVFFLQFHHFPPFRAEVAFRVPFLVRQELFLAHGVESLVGFFVKLALILQVRQDFLHAGLVARIRRGGPSVIADSQAVPQRQELPRDIVDMLLRRNAQLFSRLLHFLPMLVHPGQEIDFLPLHPVPARENVRQDFFISVPDVGRSVGVVNGRGDIVHAGDDTPFLPFCKQSHGGIPGVFFSMGWESKGGRGRNGGRGCADIPFPPRRSLLRKGLNRRKYGGAGCPLENSPNAWFRK